MISIGNLLLMTRESSSPETWSGGAGNIPFPDSLGLFLSRLLPPCSDRSNPLPLKKTVLLETPWRLLWIIILTEWSCSISSCHRPQRWVWDRADLLDGREETWDSQNKLRNKLVARGKKLCSHNLLMVCKLGLRLASSALLHLSLRFHSSDLPSLLMLGSFSVLVVRKVGC